MVSSCKCSRGQLTSGRKSAHWFGEGGGYWDLRTVLVEWWVQKAHFQDIEGLKSEAEYFKEQGCEGYRYRTVDKGRREKAHHFSSLLPLP